MNERAAAFAARWAGNGLVSRLMGRAYKFIASEQIDRDTAKICAFLTRRHIGEYILENGFVDSMRLIDDIKRMMKEE